MNSSTERTVDWPKWVADIPATLMFVIRDGKILLIEKLTGIGEGKINGPGGKIDPGETPLEAILRECQEELHITPTNPQKVGELLFDMTHIPNIHCHVFIASEYEGTPTATREANPLWTDLDAIPYDKMWEDDHHWLPQVIKGEIFYGKFLFEEETIVQSDVEFGEEVRQHWVEKRY